MPTSLRAFRIVFSLAWPLLAGLLTACSDSQVDDPPAAEEADAPVLYPRHPAPASLQELDKRILRLRRNHLIAESTRLQHELVTKLEQAWGENDVRLATYHYDLCLCFQRTGALDLAIKEGEKGLAKWPRSLQHQVVVATVRMLISQKRGQIVDGTEAAVRRLLEPDRHPQLRALHVLPEDVHVQWANILFRTGKLDDALAETDKALAISPDSRLARRLRAECLIVSDRVEPAVPILEKLVEEKPELRLRANLGLSYARTGENEKAWKVIETAHRDLVNAGVRGKGDQEIERTLRHEGAGALNALGRHRESRDFLLPWALAHPNDRKALVELAAGLRGLGLTDVAKSLTRRKSELESYHRHVSEGDAARRSGLDASASHHEIRSWLELDRLGDALDAASRGTQKSRGAVELYLDQAECSLRLGRLRRIAAQLNQMMRVTKSRRAGVCLARLFVRMGEIEAAKALAKNIEETLPADGVARATLQAHLVRLKLLFGDAETAWKMLDLEKEALRSAAPDLVLLLEAESLIAAGDLDSARAAVSQDFRSIPDGETWAGVLRLVLDDLAASDGSATAAHDPSDLCDHPELARRLRSLEVVSKNARAATRIDRALALHADVGVLLEKMGEFSDTDILPLWRDLAELFLGRGAARKAREVSWYLWRRAPHAAAENQLVARTLGRQEEVLSRLAALQRATADSPERVDLAGQLRETRATLGIAR